MNSTIQLLWTQPDYYNIVIGGTLVKGVGSVAINSNLSPLFISYKTLRHVESKICQRCKDICIDSTPIQWNMKFQSSKKGYDSIEAVDGEKGIKTVKDEKPDLVLLDLILPGIDGFEVLTKIKEDAKIAQIPVIILSNLGQKDDIEKGIKMGAVDYLIKAHFTPGEIIDKIKIILK